MKAFLVIVMSTFASVSFAGARPFADFKQIVGDTSLTGTAAKDTTCEVKTRWLANGDLEVSASSQYKQSNPRSHTVVFSVLQGAEFEMYRGAGGQSEYTVSQSKSLIASNEENVDLFESFTVNQDASGTTRLNLSVMEVNDHSDPSEVFILYCTPGL